MASKLKLTELLYPTSTTPAITINADDTVTFGAPTTTITNLSATSITDSGNLTFTGTGNRIRGDFSNATVANRVAFQTSTTNGNTFLAAYPNGTGTSAGMLVYNNSDPSNAAFIASQLIGTTEARVNSGITGTGTYLPMTFYTGGSEAMRITTDRNVGIGTISPLSQSKLTVSQDGAVTAGGLSVDQTNGASNRGGGIFLTRQGDNRASIESDYFNGLIFSNKSGAGSLTEKMRIQTDGNVGIGTSLPPQLLAVGNSTDQFGAGVSGAVTTAYFGSPSNTSGGIKRLAYDRASGSLSIIGGSVASPATQMTVDNGGNLLVGQTSWNFSNNGTQIAANGRIYNTSNTDYNLELAGSTSARIRFYTSAGGSGTTVGSITVSGSATTYATSSDYRLKENVAPMQNALATVAALKPCTYTWKADGSAGQGFIAHELQAVVPDCVTGEKDAVDKDGKPQYQGVDTSFLVATLVAAIQELKAEIDLLKGN